MLENRKVGLAAGTCKRFKHQLSRKLSTSRSQREKGEEGAPCMEARTAHASVAGILALADMRVSVNHYQSMP